MLKRGEEIFEAVRLGHVAIVQDHILANPAQIDEEFLFIQGLGEDFYSPLRYAAEFGTLEVARLLVGAGADVNIDSK
jgi:hypothetical protein